MLKGKKEFVAALVVIVIVLVVLAFPYALIATYGLEVKKLILLIQLVVLAVFSGGMLVWWLVRYRQTSHDIETLREEIDRKICGRNESEHDATEGMNKRGHKRK